MSWIRAFRPPVMGWWVILQIYKWTLGFNSVILFCPPTLSPISRIHQNYLVQLKTPMPKHRCQEVLIAHWWLAPLLVPSPSSSSSSSSSMFSVPFHESFNALLLSVFAIMVLYNFSVFWAGCDMLLDLINKGWITLVDGQDCIGGNSILWLRLLVAPALTLSVLWMCLISWMFWPHFL